MKFGVPDDVETNAIENLFVIQTKLEELVEAFEEESLEKLNKLQNLSPNLKDFSIDILLDKFPIQYEVLNIEMDSFSGEENIINMIIISFYEIIKSFKEQFKSLVKAGRPREVIAYWIEQIKKYSPVDNEIREFILPLLDIMLKENPNPEDFIQLFKSKLTK